MAGLTDKRLLLIIGGGIAAYKVLELIRRLKERGASVRAVMTAAAQHFLRMDNCAGAALVLGPFKRRGIL